MIERSKLLELAKTYGSPLYVYDANTIDRQYQRLTNAGLDPLYDDRNERAGGKFATMDLIGLPWRITVGPRGLKNGVVELTSRREGVSEDLTPEEAVNKLISIYQSV